MLGQHILHLHPYGGWVNFLLFFTGPQILPADEFSLPTPEIILSTRGKLSWSSQGTLEACIQLFEMKHPQYNVGTLLVVVTRDPCPCQPLCYRMQPLSPPGRWREWADGEFQLLPFNLPLFLQPVSQTSGGERGLLSGLKEERLKPCHSTRRAIPFSSLHLPSRALPLLLQTPFSAWENGAPLVTPGVDRWGWGATLDPHGAWFY